MWKLAYRNVTRRKGQTSLTVGITTMMIFIFAFLSLTFQLVNQGINLAEKRTGADILVQSSSISLSDKDMIFSGEPVNEYIPSTVVEQIRSIAGIKKLTTQFFTHTLAESCCSTGTPVRIVGIDLATDFIIKPWLDQKNLHTLKSHEVVIGSNIEPALGGKMMVVTEAYDVVGQLYETGTGIDDTIFISMEEARDISTKIYDLMNIWENKDPNELISSVLIQVENGKGTKEIADQINLMLPGVKAIETITTIETLRTTYRGFGVIFLFIAVLLFLCILLSLLGRYISLVNERKKEIGYLRAMGMYQTEVFLSIWLEILIHSTVGGVVGGFLGVITVWAMREKFEKLLSLPIASIQLADGIIYLFMGIGVSIIVGSISAFFPIKHSVNREIQDVISSSEL